jgi:serine/threonine protein phosphatase PrpC
VYAQTDVGLVREHNEDNFLVADLSAGVRGIDERTAIHRVGPRGSIFAVCDGMGGAAAGEVASQMAVDTLHEVMSSGPPFTDHDDFARRLVRAIEEAGARIFAAAKLDRSRRGMGTTSTVAGLVDRILFVGQIGDSRAYVLRNDELGLITKDQSLVNQLIESGQLTEEEAEAFEHANIILQALGTAENVTVDLTFLELRRGDRLMLCSDGLSGLVHAHLIKDVLATVQDPRAACATLVEMARTGGGHDNITVIVVDFDGDDLASAEGAPRPTYQQYPLPATSERRTTYPPREVGLKGGATKPGSDVKGLPAAAQHDVPAPPSGRQTWMFVALVVVLVLVGVAALAFSGTEPGREGRERRSAPGTASSVEEDDGEGHVLPPSTPLEAPEALRRVRITTDLDEAVLWVDDEEVGPFEATGGDAGVFVREVALLPGVHRFEVRSPTGARVRAEALTVEAGEDASFALDAPRAAGPENLPPSSDGVVVESGGTTRSTSGGSSQTNTDPDGGRFRRRRDAGAEGEAASPRRGGAAGVQGIPDNPF